MSFLERILFPHKSLNQHKLRKRVGGKTILITGASYGIGEALAYLLAGEEVQLILVARTLEKLKEVQANILSKGRTAHIFAADLTKAADIQAFIAFLDTLPKVDIVVSNAGKSIRRPLMDSLDRLHDFQRTMGLNYFAPVQLLLHLIPVLKQQKGQIIHISALNVLLPAPPYWAAYQASKVAFDNWFRSASFELQREGIDCNSIYLPLVKTRMIEPTKSYQNAPAMSKEQAAIVIANKMIKKRGDFAPWWLFPLRFAAFLLPTKKIMELFFSDSKK